MPFLSILFETVTFIRGAGSEAEALSGRVIAEGPVLVTVSVERGGAIAYETVERSKLVMGRCISDRLSPMENVDVITKKLNG